MSLIILKHIIPNIDTA